MTCALLLTALLSSVALFAVQASEATPITKVVQLLADLESKIIGEGEAAQKTYTEFAEFCEEQSHNLAFSIKTAQREKASLEATITEESALIGSLEEKIEELGAEIKTDEADLKAATDIRGHESSVFAAEEKELMETVDTLARAVGILEKHASLLQAKNAGNFAQALEVMVQASALSSADGTQLTALLQNAQSEKDTDGNGDVGAPAAAVYEGHSGDIVATLQGLLEKAEDQLASSRKTETTNVHNFELMKQALEDEIKNGKKDMSKSKKSLAESSDKKAAAEGDLAQTEKQLKADTAASADLHQDCMAKAQAYEAETKSRGEELKALGVAKKAINDNTVGAAGLSYGLTQVSFLQTSSSAFAAVHFLRELAKSQHAPALAQLAARMDSAMQSRTGDDAFGKVKGLIADMIEKLEAEAEADATHKAFCDKELSETHVKQADKNAEIEKLTTKIDGMAARSSQLKGEVAALEKALAELARAQLEMDKLRNEENSEYVSAKADMEQGIEGVKIALKVLRDYYSNNDKAHASADGAGTGIIGLLEVCESDFVTGLAERTATEEAAAASYDKETKENEIEKTTKQQDVKYKTQEATDLDKAISEASSDREGVHTELAAVMEYLSELEKECIEKAETYEERKGRFEAELAGLRQALKILGGESASFIQKRSLRAVHHHSM